MELVNIVGHAGLVRDIDSKALLNTDMTALERYKRQSKIFEDAKEKVESIDQLKSEMKEIKELLLLLLSKGEN